MIITLSGLSELFPRCIHACAEVLGRVRDAMNPVEVERDVDVHPRDARVAAADTPRHEAGQLEGAVPSLAHQRASAVTLKERKAMRGSSLEVGFQSRRERPCFGVRNRFRNKLNFHYKGINRTVSLVPLDSWRKIKKRRNQQNS